MPAAKGTIPQLQADVLKAQLDKPVAIEIHTLGLGVKLHVKQVLMDMGMVGVT